MAALTPSRELALWAGSFLLAAVILISCFGAPLVPVAVAGMATLLLTVLRRLWSSKKTLRSGGPSNKD